MKNAVAIFRRHLAETLKNKVILIQFFMFPALYLFMDKCIEMKGMPDNFFENMFSVMFIGMAPLICMASLIAEEKEKNTLRVLMMSNVRPGEYLFGTGAYVFVMCMAGTAVFAAGGGYRGTELAQFIALMSAGIILSELTGAVVGIFSKDQMSATSIYVPFMLVFSILPMASMFNSTVKKISRVTYSQQISELIGGIGTSAGISAMSLAVIALNFTAAAVLFMLAYRRKGLE